MNLKEQLIREEGSVPFAYQDSRGFWTIGVGRLIDKRKGGKLSPDEIEYLLQNDIKRVTAEVLASLPWVNTMNEARQAVVYGMAFQLGLKGLLGFTSTLSAMRDQRYEHAAEGMRLSVWAQQTPERVKRLAHQMDTGEWQ